MKKIILAAVAASVVAAPVAAAPFDRHDNRRVVQVKNQKVTVVNKRNGRQVVKVKQNNRRWNRGQRFDRRQVRNYRVINDYRAYRLQAPPRGYRYVQSDNDVVMVAIASGLIGAVFANFF